MSETHEHLHKHENTKIVIDELNQITDELQEIKQMVADNVDCTEVLNKLTVVKTNINVVGKTISDDHIAHCISHAVEIGDQKAIDNLLLAISQFLK